MIKINLQLFAPCNCTGWCSGGCTGGCGNGCGNCCNNSCCDTCVLGCGACDGTCRGCGGTCSGGCRGGCDGCSGTCSGSCTSCSGSCTGGCGGSCRNSCDNACTSSSAASVIANLGNNIGLGRIIKQEDFNELKSKMRNEVSRRNRNSNHDFSITPSTGTSVMLEHLQKIKNEESLLKNSTANSLPQNKLVISSELNDLIDYVKTLMTQNTK